MGAFRDDLTMIEHDNPIRLTDRGQTMSNNQCCAIVLEFLERLLELNLLL